MAREMNRIIECVPNFSEGRNQAVIDSIVEAISLAGTVDDRVQVLHVDAGIGAHRTVVTFVGSPEAVCEAAFAGVCAASRLIDMRLHHGTHPRIGATDVLPLVPVKNVTLAECAQMARDLAARIARELGIPCYCYEAAASTPDRRNLAVCRQGEYESLAEKMADPLRRPDYGPAVFDEVCARSGAVCVGARNFLIAVNFNLDTTSVPVATEIACDVREKGRKVTLSNGIATWHRGPLKGCKAIGWYIDEYGIAQVSMNVTDISVTPLHLAFDTVCRAALARGVQVTGTEIIGLVPQSVLLDAGRHYAPSETDPTALMARAIEAMGLDDLCPFIPSEKVIELRMQAASATPAQ